MSAGTDMRSRHVLHSVEKSAMGCCSVQPGPPKENYKCQLSLRAGSFVENTATVFRRSLSRADGL